MYILNGRVRTHGFFSGQGLIDRGEDKKDFLDHRDEGLSTRVTET